MAKAEPGVAGRPSIDRAPIIEKLCDQLENGIPMTVICQQPGMPSARSIRGWMADDPAIFAEIARSREFGEEFMLESTIAISDNLDEDPASRKVRIWARHEAMKRQNPNRWGDKSAMDVTSGGKTLPPINFTLPATFMRRRGQGVEGGEETPAAE